MENETYVSFFPLALPLEKELIDYVKQLGFILFKNLTKNF